jgi:hypothetical protein
MPKGPAAQIVICSPQMNPAVQQRWAETHRMTDFYGIRTNVFAVLWVRKDLWERHLRRSGRL